MTRKEALDILKEGNDLNRGRWYEHSLLTGKIAKIIAKRLGLDEGKAEIYGILHDIGRRFGRVKSRHSILGYKYLKDKGYEDIARICITHNFPDKNANEVIGNDFIDGEYEFCKKFLDSIEYDIYDKLIILCDNLALPTGITLIERRFIDVQLRYGEYKYNEIWRSVLKIQKEIEEKIGVSIYSLFYEVSDNIIKKKIDECIDI